jgi:hypothetical protein
MYNPPEFPRPVGGTKAVSTAAVTLRAKRAKVLDTSALDRDATENKDAVLGERPPEATNPHAPTDEPPRAIVQFDSEQQGLRILGRLAIGDATALRDCGLEPEGEYDTQVHEWGMGRDRDGVFWLVRGGRGEINWGSLPKMTAVAHTHPNDTPFNKQEVIDNLASWLQQPLQGPLRSLADALNAWRDDPGYPTIGFMPGKMWYLFPSDADLVSAYTAFSKSPEAIYSPYRLGSDGWPSQTDGPPLGVACGPVRVQLKKTAAADIVDLLMARKSVEDVENACITLFLAPVMFTSQISQGFLTCPPLAGGMGGTIERTGMVYIRQLDPQINLWTRHQLQQLIKTVRQKNLREQSIERIITEKAKSGW